MANEKELHRELISDKLIFLDKHRAHLHNELDKHIDTTVNVGKAWLDDTDINQLSVHDLCLLLDNAAIFLSQKVSEIKHITEAPGSEVALPSEVSPTKETASSGDQVKTSYFVSLKSIGEKITSLEQALKEVSANQGQTDENVKQMLNETNKRFEDISVTHNETRATVANISTRLQETQESFVKISFAQSEMDERITKSSATLNDIQGQVGTLSSEQRRTNERTDELSIKHSGVEEMIKKITAQQNETSENTEKLLANLSETRERVEEMFTKQFETSARVEQVSNKLAETDLRTDLFISQQTETDKKMEVFSAELSDLDDTLEKMSSEIHELKRIIGDISLLKAAAQMVAENSRDTSLVQTLLVMKERDLKKFRELENEVASVKKQAQKDVWKVRGQFKEVEQQYKMMCHMVADRLLPLEKLRDVFNEKSKYRGENIDKLNTLVNDVATLDAEVTKLANPVKSKVGFTAYFPEASIVTQGSVLTNFTRVIVDAGKHFNTTTGKFTAPLNGMYFVSVTLWQCDERAIEVSVVCKSPRSATGNQVCLVGTGYQMKSGTAVGVVTMKAGDVLFVKVEKVWGEVQLTHGTSFSCFFIG